jgi:hypothetical protein
MKVIQDFLGIKDFEAGTQISKANINHDYYRELFVISQHSRRCSFSYQEGKGRREQEK